MGRRRYDDIRREISLEIDMEQFIRENSKGNKEENVNIWRRKHVRKIREKLARINESFPDPLEKPITEDWRGIIDDEYGDTGYHYRILQVEDPNDWTDDEINEYIMDEVGYPPICSPYDCTGKRFTSGTSWSRKPVGIVMIHRWGTDV